MKSTLPTLVAVAACVLGLSVSAFAADAPTKGVDTGAGGGPGSGEKGAALYHVVSLKFKPTATKEQVREVEEAFRALKTKVPGITSLHWGTNVSPEKHDKGFTHCFVLTFAADKDRDAYLTHPEHQAFGKLLGPVLADVTVIDFWAKE